MHMRFFFSLVAVTYDWWKRSNIDREVDRRLLIRAIKIIRAWTRVMAMERAKEWIEEGFEEFIKIDICKHFRMWMTSKMRS